MNERKPSISRSQKRRFDIQIPRDLSEIVNILKAAYDGRKAVSTSTLSPSIVLYIRYALYDLKLLEEARYGIDELTGDGLLFFTWLQDSERFKYAAERYEKGMSLADVFEVLGTHGHAFGPLPKEESI